MIEDFPYVGMDYRGDPELVLPPGENWDESGMCFWFLSYLNVFEFSHLYMFLVYIIGFLTCFFRNADTGMVRPLGMAPFKRRLEGVGGIDGNLLDHLEYLTAHVVGGKDE